MILIDTSAWVEFLRDTHSNACERVATSLGGEFATCDPICMELLAGATSESHARALRRLLDRATVVSTHSRDFEAAAEIYRAGRYQGVTIRSLMDCLIAAVAIRESISLLHSDRDFATIASISPLRLA